MHIKFGLFILLGILGCFGASTLHAAPILLTISETEAGQTVGWWPNQPGMDKAWVDGFTGQGVQVVNPATLPSRPRLSPVVYGQKPLSDTNARTMASLFGAQNVLNGDVVWVCAEEVASSSDLDIIKCTGTANLTLLYGRQEKSDLKFSASAFAQTTEAAKDAVRARLIVDMALPIMMRTKGSGDIPAYIDKPVILFDPLPDADTLVAVRKQLKQVPGVQDVAECWVADGVLALEINPAAQVMSFEEFSLIIQGFMGQPTENFMIRETRRTPAGVVFEIVKY